MNKYQELVSLIEGHGLKIKSKKCYDAQSGWHGEELWITDGEKTVYDLSVNGYCFSDSSVDEALKVIKAYINKINMNSFEAFSEWVDRNKVAE